ncbi:GntR family transcriptional regulator [Taibaiella koreensis]|uniref:GntR family transcriptional regulator n=1 Tax=Taibaiella koreensis TaxID=1268548 RepID=UPI001F09F0EE|nr:GntR family transcriptional regulator [Taibaiella koreensis]
MLRPWKLEIQLDGQSDKAIYLQIADAVIAAIRTGRLKGGDALPGGRQLAALLHVNRNTIVEALNVLQQEEWIVAIPRRGVFVAEALPRLPQAKGKTSPRRPNPQPEKHPGMIVFDDGHPDSKIAPVAGLARAYRQLFQQQARWQMMGYSEATGTPAFRMAMAQMLNQQRGMRLDQDQLCITRGSQMALYLAAHSLLEKEIMSWSKTPATVLHGKSSRRPGPGCCR